MNNVLFMFKILTHSVHHYFKNIIAIFLAFLSTNSCVHLFHPDIMSQLRVATFQVRVAND